MSVYFVIILHIYVCKHVLNMVDTWCKHVSNNGVSPSVNMYYIIGLTSLQSEEELLRNLMLSQVSVREVGREGGRDVQRE